MTDGLKTSSRNSKGNIGSGARNERGVEKYIRTVGSGTTHLVLLVFLLFDVGATLFIRSHA